MTNAKEIIGKVVSGKNLSPKETRLIFSKIMQGRLTDAQIGAFLAALRLKGETIDEITAAAEVMRARAQKVRVKGFCMDTCGTGGSGKNIFNISTVTALILAACGITVAKHGNRSVSSRCGSADVLESLGVNILLKARTVERIIGETGIGFMFAPYFHMSMKNVAGPRREIGVRTIFNLLGPLCNPASPKCQLLGVYSDSLLVPFAKVLKRLKVKRALVVYSHDGLDEISIADKTNVAELRSGKIRRYTITPGQFGLKYRSLGSVKGGNAKTNAGIIRDILKGKNSAKKDMALMNAAAGLYIAGKAKNFKRGMELAREAVDSGEAGEILKNLIKSSKKTK